MQRNIIFDLGNVLIQWNPDKVYLDYFDGDMRKVKNFYTETAIFKWNEQIDAGMPIKDVIEQLVNNYPQYREPIMLWQTKWLDMIGGEITDSVAILRVLHANKVPLFALTNWSLETFLPYIRSHYSFLNFFKDIVISGMEKVIKPDVKIYKILLERNKLQAQNCLFIDDNASNLAPARELGMDVIKFETPQQLRDDLIKREILPVV